MTRLHDRLDELADEAPALTSPTGGDDLWERGRKLQRRRRAVSVALVGALVLTLGSLTTLVVEATVQRSIPAADTDAVLGLPDELHAPSPWAPGVDETDPIGPLVAVVEAERRSFWGERSAGIAGVSSAGEYAFLTLDGRAQVDLVDAARPALSPDGRFLAYPVTGETRQDRNTLVGDPVVGLAVYDSVAGDTSVQRIPTDHGIAVGDLVWIGGTVVMTYRQYDTFSQTSFGSTARTTDPGALRWDPAAGVVDPEARASDYSSLANAAAVGDGLAVPRGQRSLVVIDSDGGVLQRARVDVRIEGSQLVSPDGSRVAGREDPDGASTDGGGRSPIVVADIAGPRAGITQDVVVSRSEPLAWRGNDQLVVVDDGRSDGYASLVAIDVETGVAEPLTEVRRGVGTLPQVADDAWSGPVFDAPEPDGPGDPRRIVWLGGALLVLLAGAAAWRSRVRLR